VSLPTKTAGVSVLVSNGARTDIINAAGATCAALLGGDKPLEAAVSTAATAWKGKAGVSVPESFSVRKLEKEAWGSEAGGVGATNGGEEKEKKPACMFCGEGFTFTRRQHHCRLCGALVCGSCSVKKLLLPTTDTLKLSGTENIRVCDGCYNRTKNEMLVRSASASRADVLQQPAAAPRAPRSRRTRRNKSTSASRPSSWAPRTSGRGRVTG
jgi:hypothetical protein